MPFGLRCRTCATEPEGPKRGEIKLHSQGRDHVLCNYRFLLVSPPGGVKYPSGIFSGNAVCRKIRTIRLDRIANA